MTPEGLRLHLGCGNKRLAGYVNVDSRPDVGADLVANIMDLSSLPDDYADLIYVCHALEHVPAARQLATLKGWRRILKAGGILRISVPDWRAMAEMYVNDGVALKVFIAALFGGQEYPENFHYTTHDWQSLSELLLDAGFHRVMGWKPSEVLPATGFSDYSTTIIGGRPISLNMEATAR